MYRIKRTETIENKKNLIKYKLADQRVQAENQYLNKGNKQFSHILGKTSVMSKIILFQERFGQGMRKWIIRAFRDAPRFIKNFLELGFAKQLVEI